jgi:hydroxymethylpyrimidine pyrophosphatase-like HAD family hydrolase
MTEIEPLEKALTEDPLQISFNGSVVDMRRLDKYLRSFSIAQHVTITRTEYEDKDFILLDVTSQNCSKGTALSSWSSMLGVDRSEVMAVGDNLNDRDMLDAVPELKALGWPMTRKHDEGGLADAIRSIALTSS